MIRNAARSRPRRERSRLARDVVTNRDRAMQNRTCSTTAATATITPSPPLAKPTVTPSRPTTLASGQKPVNDAASRPTASGRVRSGYSASVEGAIHAEDQDRRYQPAEREHREDDRSELHRRALTAEPGQDDEGEDCQEHGERRADDERDLRGVGRSQRVEQQAQLQLDEEPSHDSTSLSVACGPTRSMNARCSVLPPRTSSMVPVTTILPLSMIDTWSQTCSTSSMT